MSLNERQKAFVTAYLQTQDGEQAAVMAGYAAKNALRQARRLLSNPAVGEEIDRQRRGKINAIWPKADIVQGLRQIAADTDNPLNHRLKAYELVCKIEGLFASGGTEEKDGGSYEQQLFEFIRQIEGKRDKTV